MTKDEKGNFITNSIASPSLTAMGKNLDAVYKNANKKINANNRAARILGAGTIKYNNGATPIIFNKKKLK